MNDELRDGLLRVTNDLNLKCELIKSKNVYALHKLNDELNKFLDHAQSIVKLCLNEKNDLMGLIDSFNTCHSEFKDMMGQMTRIVSSKSNKKPKKGISTVLNTTDEDERDFKMNKPVVHENDQQQHRDLRNQPFALCIPETLDVNMIQSEVTRVEQQPKSMKPMVSIKIEATQPSVKPFIQQKNTLMNSKNMLNSPLLSSHKNQSTPKSIKKVLSDHGLNDLSNPSLILVDDKTPNKTGNSDLNYTQDFEFTTSNKNGQSDNMGMESPRMVQKTKRFKQLTMSQAFNNQKSKLSASFENDSSDLAIVEGYTTANQKTDNVLRSRQACTKENINRNNNNDDDDDDLIFNFDNVPKSTAAMGKLDHAQTNGTSPKYKYVQVVRKHDERKKLNTNTCKQCEDYWKSVPDDVRQNQMQQSCRHREKYAAPPTPEHYWSITFPTTPECVERGYGGILKDNNDNGGVVRARRKRPLKFVENKSNQNDGLDDYNEDFMD